MGNQPGSEPITPYIVGTPVQYTGRKLDAVYVPPAPPSGPKPGSIIATRVDPDTGLPIPMAPKPPQIGVDFETGKKTYDTTTYDISKLTPIEDSPDVYKWILIGGGVLVLIILLK